MAENIFTKPITKTEFTAPTTIYTQSIKLDDGEYQTVEFPACLEEMTEENRKYLIQGILVNHLQNNQ